MPTKAGRRPQHQQQQLEDSAAEAARSRSLAADSPFLVLGVSLQSPRALLFAPAAAMKASAACAFAAALVSAADSAGHWRIEAGSRRHRRPIRLDSVPRECKPHTPRCSSNRRNRIRLPQRSIQPGDAANLLINLARASFPYAIQYAARDTVPSSFPVRMHEISQPMMKSVINRRPAACVRERASAGQPT